MASIHMLIQLYFYHSLLRIIFVLILLAVSFTLGIRHTNSRRKMTPFECGFDPKDSARLPFSIRFFLLAVVFLIFDIEIALLFPVIVGFITINYKYAITSGVIFLIILLLGLIHEWNQGSLRWVL